jgi:glycerol-3-phosphate acyltransferase PlsY
MVLTWLTVVILSGFVGLASMAGAVAVAAAIAARYSGAHPELLVFGVLAALLIMYTHRGNIGRMLAGTEPRARRLWLFGLRRGPG